MENDQYLSSLRQAYMHECSGGDDHMTWTILHQAEHFSLSVHQNNLPPNSRENPTHRDPLDIFTALFWIFGRTLVCAWTDSALGRLGWIMWLYLGRILCLDGFCAWMDVLEDYGGL